MSNETFAAIQEEFTITEDKDFIYPFRDVLKGTSKTHDEELYQEIHEDLNHASNN